MKEQDSRGVRCQRGRECLDVNVQNIEGECERVTPGKGIKNKNPTTFNSSNDGSSGSDSRVHFTRPILMTMILVCF